MQSAASRVALVLALFSGSALPAQAVPEEAPGNPRPTLERAAEDLLSVKFSGGNLVEYVEALKDAARDLNVVFDVEEAVRVEMPPVSLKGVTAESALMVIEIAYKSDELAVKCRPISGRGAGADVYVLSVAPQASRTPMPGQALGSRKRRLAVLPLGEGATGDSREAEDRLKVLMTAVDAALGIQADGSKTMPVIKLHADTGLLMVNGTEEQIAAVTTVLAEAGQPTRKGPPAPAEGELKALKAQVAALIEEVKRLRADLDERQGREEVLKPGRPELPQKAPPAAK